MAGSGSPAPEFRQLKLELNPLPLTTSDIDIPSVLLSVKVGNIYGGYNPDLFDELVEDFFLCHICKGILRDALLTPCGHVFCKACLSQTRLYSQTTETRCPLDNTLMELESIREEDFINRWVRQKRIQCPLKAKGCEWNGELGDCKRHLSTACLMYRVKCSLGCGVVVMRCELDSHISKQCMMRKVNCQYCTGEVSLGEMEEHWSIGCNLYPILCPNSCQSSTVERCKLKRHLDQDCPLTVLPCKYQKYGCEHECSRRDLTGHLSANVQLHLEHLYQHSQLQEECHRSEMGTLGRQISSLQDSIASITNKSPYVWKVRKINALMEDGGTLLSPSLFTSEGIHFSVKLHCNGLDENSDSFLSLVASFPHVTTSSDNSPLRLKFDCSLLNQTSDDSHYMVSTQFNVLEPGEVVDASLVKFVSHRQVRQSSSLVLFLKDDIVYLKISAHLVTSLSKPWLHDH